MPKVAHRRPAAAVTLSVAAHVAVLLLAVAWRPTIPIPDTPEVPAPDAITVRLVRLPPATGRPAPLRVHRVQQPPSQAGPPIAPVTAAPPGPEPTPPGPVAAAPDLRLSLRRGAAGCVNMASVGMSRAERDGCNERLGHAMAGEKFLPAAIGTRIRAYYDQVALAKAPDPQPVRLTAQGASGPGAAGIFSVDERNVSGHGPHVGCSIPFGVGKKPPKLPHAFYLGPCFIEPPAGSLTPDVDVIPP